MRLFQAGGRRSLVLPGIALTVAAWFVFSAHDASVKLLVEDLSAWQVLFARSVVILGFCRLARGDGGLACCWKLPARNQLLLGALLYAGAWLAYFTAARSLQLAELETVYFASPIIMTVLAVIVLREKVTLSRWAGVGVGFVGVVIACQPGSPQQNGPIGLALLAAALWAYAIVLLRQHAGSVPASAQMALNNAVFLVLSGATLPSWWVTPTMSEVALMLLVGMGGALAQYLLYEGIQRAPASVLAPLEYTGLLWSFGLGFAIWGDIPPTAVFVGAALIVLSGAMVILAEWRNEQQPDTMPRSFGERWLRAWGKLVLERSRLRAMTVRSRS
jgi:drug/metabolite transporter (DMT)-like permease